MSFVIAVLPIIIGFVLDCILGDPYRLPHPVRLIGRLISVLEEYVRKRFKNLRSGGIFLAVIVLFMSTAIPIWYNIRVATQCEKHCKTTLIFIQ